MGEINSILFDEMQVIETVLFTSSGRFSSSSQLAA